jgi:glucuronate isomerase
LDNIINQGRHFHKKDSSVPQYAEFKYAFRYRFGRFLSIGGRSCHHAAASARYVTTAAGMCIKQEKL